MFLYFSRISLADLVKIHRRLSTPFRLVVKRHFWKMYVSGATPFDILAFHIWHLLRCYRVASLKKKEKKRERERERERERKAGTWKIPFSTDRKKWKNSINLIRDSLYDSECTRAIFYLRAQRKKRMHGTQLNKICWPNKIARHSGEIFTVRARLFFYKPPCRGEILFQKSCRFLSFHFVFLVCACTSVSWLLYNHLRDLYSLCS